MGDGTRRLGAAEVEAAAAILRAGGLVALPTETVYGLGADARDGRAVARVFEAKGRPRFNPLIAHVADAGAAFALGEAGPDARALAEAFWPGPLTLVLPLREGSGLSDLVTAGTGRVAVRVPSHPLARALLGALGGPVAAPSANPSGRVSPTTADARAGRARRAGSTRCSTAGPAPWGSRAPSSGSATARRGSCGPAG